MAGGLLIGQYGALQIEGQSARVERKKGAWKDGQ
jgi:hypothetical protein